MAKIVILDGYLVNPGDLSWDPLLNLGSSEIFDRTPAELVIQRCQDAEIVITNKVRLGEKEFQALPKLKYIGVTATGYDIIDVVAAKKCNITVTNVPAYSTPSTAQQAIALLLEICNQVGYHNTTVQEGEWARSQDFAYWRKPLIELKDLKMGIIGFGAIGQTVATIAHTLGMKILALYRNNVTKVPLTSFEVIAVDQDTLFRESDVISLHCPLNDETRKIINKSTLALMKPNAILINAARGGLVDEEALALALKQGQIYAAGLDVLTSEPPPASCPLLNLKNCIITPHNAWAATASRKRLLDATIDNIKAYLSGSPTNVVTLK